MIILRSILGLVFFCFIAWLMSSNRRRFPWRLAATGVLLQFALAWLLLETTIGIAMFQGASSFVAKLASVAEPGAKLVFGPIADFDQMAAIFGPQSGFVFAFAGKGLILLIFFSALMAVLYHIGIMQVVVWCLARVMSLVMGVSGAEAMAMAANVFVGNTEAPLVVRPFVPRMTLSELNALMTGGFATIAGTVLAVYMGILGEELGPHLLSASVLSAPAAFVVAKIMRPETEVSETSGKIKFQLNRSSSNLIEAATDGTTTGLKLWLNVIAMLIAFMALVNLVNWPIGWFGELLEIDGGLSLQRFFGWVFAPVAWLMGVEGWHDSQLMGTLLGTKVSINEFVALTEMTKCLPGGETPFESSRTAAMAAYALCGFANFGSMGVQIGGLAPLAPDRKADISKLAFKAMIGGAFASWMTATIAGAFL
ncbi:MAG: CNT family concentrative nucleoside transporter [Planctomycetota bacterium]|jgi:CNT family concentrative nucleoside transporter